MKNDLQFLKYFLYFSLFIFSLYILYLFLFVEENLNENSNEQQLILKLIEDNNKRFDLLIQQNKELIQIISYNDNILKNLIKKPISIY